MEVSTNRKALRDYHILERYEAGLELLGTEVKSIRAGKANINEAFARIENGKAILYGADIQPYDKAGFENHVSKRPRNLLLHKAEIDKLHGIVNVKGLTLVALRLYWKQHRVKVEIGVGKGKDSGDKRDDLKQKAVRRETERTMAEFNKRRAHS